MPKEKNIIIVNRKELSKRQVVKKENLESLLSKHKMITKRPVYKQKKFYFFLFLLLVITFLIYYSDKQEKGKEIQKKEQTN
ncbi:MAG: hypothetical protein COA97_03395 [Flavobacteriales bacterium]|nr:MAG: hypothetical protein COA97_03395 [Flavobacteriales bacterium]